MMDLTIRPAAASDSEAIFALLKELAITYTPDRAAFERHYPELLQSGSAALCVAALEGQVVGYALAFEALTLYANGTVTELQELVVDPRHRGKGIGRKLVESVVERARASGSVEVTVPTNRAGRYYQRLGFEERAAYYALRLGP
jgi:N-acetylglutamate synthase-like GNAT family acetyltransferase